MRKSLFFITILVLLSFSVMAEEMNEAEKMADRTDEKTDVQERAADSVRNTEDAAPKPALISAEAEQKVTAKQLREREKLKEIDEERLEKLAKLREKNREKLEALNQEQIKKLTAVKAERLAKISRNLNQKNLEKIASLDQRQLEKLAALDRTRLKEYAQLGNEELKTKLENIKVIKVAAENAFKERVIAEERLKLAKEELKQAKERYEKAKEQFREQKRLLLEAGDEAAKIEHLKEYLANAVDVVIERLNTLKEKINENENIDEAAAKERTGDIGTRISNLEELKTKIESATTLDELKKIGKDVSQKWKEIKENNKIRETQLLRANVQEVLKRSEHLEARLEKVLADMEEKGISVEGINARIDSFSAKIDEARELFKQSLNKFNEAKQDKAEATVKEAQKLAKEANTKLREAHELLVETVKEIREAGGNAEEVEEETGEIEIVEVEEEDEEEDEDE